MLMAEHLSLDGSGSKVEGPLRAQAAVGVHNAPSNEWSECFRKSGKLSLIPAVNTVKYNTIQYSLYLCLCLKPNFKTYSNLWIRRTLGLG
jgi:hypothetical protein